MIRLVDGADFGGLLDEVDFGRLLAAHSIPPEALEPPACGEPLKKLLLLTYLPEPFATRFSSEQVFWSRYFHFVVFALRRKAVLGPDAGLEQQVFQLLEEAERHQVVDWTVLEQIEELASAQARSALPR